MASPAAEDWRKSSWSTWNGNCVEWRRASLCNGGSCAEVALRGGTVQVRDSKMAPRPGCEGPAGPVLAFGAGDWRVFLAAVKAGELGGLG